MLVKWGTDKADELGIIAKLTASASGYPLYLKHGYKLITEDELDLRPFGVDETEIRRNMIREPVRKMVYELGA